MKGLSKERHYIGLSLDHWMKAMNSDNITKLFGYNEFMSFSQFQSVLNWKESEYIRFVQWSGVMFAKHFKLTHL